MTVISYAKNFEDIMLLRALGDIDRGFFIDVGVCDPTANNATRLLYELGWRGVNVAPASDCATRLVSERPGDRTRVVELSSAEGTATLNFIPDNGLSTLAFEVDNGERPRGRDVQPDPVPVTTLRQLWDEEVEPEQEVHVLKISIRGGEDRIIRGADWQRHRPWIVVVETPALNRLTPSHLAWEPLLLEQGYRFVYWDGLNRFFLAEERLEREAAFHAPPNLFDDFVPYRCFLLEAQNQWLSTQNENLRGDVAFLEAKLYAARGDLVALRSALGAAGAELTARESLISDARRDLAAAFEENAKLKVELSFFDRPLWQRLAFRRRDGRPTKALRKLLFNCSGKPRGLFRGWVLRSDGHPRAAFAVWMKSPQYQALPCSVPVERSPLAAPAMEDVDEPHGNERLTPRTRYFLGRLQQDRPTDET